MRLSRSIVIVLALLVSPVGAAVCEVVCGTPGHAAAHAPAAVQTDAHAHHDHHAHQASAVTPLATPASDTDGRVRVPGPECDPVLEIPARVRSTFSGPDLHAAVAAHAAYTFDSQVLTLPRVVIADTGPPDPPRHAPIPLRI